MEKNKVDAQVNRTEKQERLWQDFEKTGSIQSYLLFTGKTEIPREVDPFQTPAK